MRGIDKIPERESAPKGEAAAAVGIERFTRRHFKRLTLLLSLVAFAFVLAVTSRSGFHADDIVNLSLAHDDGLTIGFLTNPVTDDHLIPGHRLITWLVYASGPKWEFWMIFCSLMYAAMVAACSFFVKLVSESSSVALLGACSLLACVPFLRASLWMSSGAGEIPGALLVFISGIALIRWDENRNGKALAVSGLAFAASLLVFEKFAVIAGALIVLLVIARPPERGITFQSVIGRARSCLPAIATLTSIAVADLVMVRLTKLENGGVSQATHITLDTWLQMFAAWWQHGIGALVVNGNTVTNLGGTISDAKNLNPHPQVDDNAFAGLIILAGLAAATVRGRRSVLVWVALVVALLANGIVMALGRISLHGIDYLMDPRYFTTSVVTMVMLVPAAWNAAGRPRPKTSVQVGGCLTALSAMVVLWAVNGSGAINNWSVVPARAAKYAATFRDSLSSVTNRYPDSSVLDEPVPLIVGIWRLGKIGTVSTVAPLFAPDLPIAMNQPVGRVSRVDNAGRASLVNTPPPTALRLSAGAHRCGSSLAGSNFFYRAAQFANSEIPAAIRAAGAKLLVTVRIRAASRRGFLMLAPGDGGWPIATYPLSENPLGLRAIVGPKVKSVKVVLTDGAAACVTGIEVTPLPPLAAADQALD